MPQRSTLKILQTSVIDKSILKTYKPGDTQIVFHEDEPDLDTIIVPLPETPDFSLIDGYGLPAHQQKFRKQEIPRKIRDLQIERTHERSKEGTLLTQDQIWDRILSDIEFYREEILFIATQWERRINGYWFFNNGKATFIDGWHYVYLNFWELDTGLPEYRDRDRKFFLMARYCLKHPRLFGFIYPKHRREGATSKASCINYCIVSMLGRAHSGIQSMTEGHANTVFQKHVIDPWKTSMPFFFKPNNDGGDDPKGKLSFRAPTAKGLAGTKHRSTKTLLSSITFGPSNVKLYDTWKLHFYHSDECGKTEEVDINERWRIVKLCLSQGAGASIHGLSIHTSTVGNLAKGGENFRKLCKSSMYNGADQSRTQTTSGLTICFIPAYEGLDWYVDEFGNSIVETPTEQQRTYLKTRIDPTTGLPGCPDPNIGAKEYIAQKVAVLEAGDDYEEYAEFMRQHPTRFRGCFISSESKSNFNLMKLNKRIDELRYIKDATVTGNFELLNENVGFRGGVRFVPNEKGLFKLSKVLDAQEANNIYFDGLTYKARNAVFCAGGDPFKSNRTKYKRRSNGGGAVFWGHDHRIDPIGKPVDEWISNRFICTYNHRPATKEIYCQHMLMMCIYFGCPMYAEIDVPVLPEYFEEQGFGGMLVHRYDRAKFDLVPGVNARRSGERMFMEYQTYIENHCFRERHVELLEECRDIEDVDDITNWDLFAAGGYSQLGIAQYLPRLQYDEQEQSLSVTDFFEEFTS